MGLLSIIRDFQEILLKTGLPHIIVSFLMGLFALILGATIHEFGHHLVAAILGTGVPITHVQIMTGVTEFQPMGNGKHILVAFAGPLLAYFVGMYMWFLNKDHLIRSVGSIIVFFSFIPSFFPSLPGSDMSYAIVNGFPSAIGWIIWALLTGFFLASYNDEITEGDFLR